MSREAHSTSGRSSTLSWEDSGCASSSRAPLVRRVRPARSFQISHLRYWVLEASQSTGWVSVSQETQPDLVDEPLAFRSGGLHCSF